MRVYIRHADKEYSNGKSESCKHDPPITENSPTHCYLKSRELISRYGLPFVIVCSPYRRTRETAIKMMEYIKEKYKLDIPIKIDTRLSEYLGNRQNEKLDVTNDTLKYEPPHPENFHQMDSRVRWHNDIYSKLDEYPEVVWFITHGFIINRIGNAMGFKLPHRISYLSSATFLPNSQKYRCEINSGPFWTTLYKD